MVTLRMFSASHCVPCKTIIDPVRKICDELEWELEEVDVGIDPLIRDKHKVQSLPTFAVIRDDREIGRLEGARNAERLKQMLVSLSVN